MRKQTPSLDWQIVEDDAEWEHQQTLFAAEIEPSPQRVSFITDYLWLGLTVIVLTSVAGHWWWRTVQARAQQAQAAATVLAQQSLVTRPADLTALTATIEQSRPTASYPYSGFTHTSARRIAPEDYLDADLRLVEFQGNQAVVSLTLADSSGTPLYRQTRIYSRTAMGWQRTPPEADLWGAKQVRATPYFRYHYRQRDGETVQAIAATMDNLYTRLSHDLGLPIDPLTTKLVIDVTVDQLPAEDLPAFDAQHYVRVRSPALYVAPIDLPDEQLLAQAIALPLLRNRVMQAAEHHKIGPEWQAVVEGLALWQLWQTELPLAAWRDEIVRWQYTALPAAQPGAKIALPAHYQELCASHRLWMWSPIQIDIPLVCVEGDWEHWHWNGWKASAPLTHLEQLALPSPAALEKWGSFGLGAPVHINHPGRKVALSTLIEYAVSTYGRERLALLVASLGQHQTWDTLLPAVFDVTAAEFEQGWQSYLVTHYGARLEPE